MVYQDYNMSGPLAVSSASFMCKFQRKISRSIPLLVRKPGAAEGRIAMRKSRIQIFSNSQMQTRSKMNLL